MPLNILQLLLIHPEIVAQFMDDRQADLFADFGLAGADRFNWGNTDRGEDFAEN